MPAPAHALFEPGALLRLPGQEDWGLGQVQSLDGARLTVNFEHAGKRTLDLNAVQPVFVGADPRDEG